MKILVVGCSMTRGHGLDLESVDPKLWVNQLLNQSFQNPEIVNLSKTGANNHWIFCETATSLINESYDIVIVGWSEISRLNFNLGLELYSTLTRFTGEFETNLNNYETVSKKWLLETGDRLRRFYNDHWSLLDLIKYSNILINIQLQRKSQVFFVNTMTPIPDDYFEFKNFKFPSELTDFERTMLQTESRDNDEIQELYSDIHRQYHQYGGFQKSHWLNLNDTIISMRVDDASDTDRHPGYQTQDLFYEFLLPRFTTALEN